MHGVHLHAVHARVLQELRALGERLDELMDLCLRHFARGQFIRPAVGRGTCGRGDLVEIHKRLADSTQHRIVIQHLHHGTDREGTAEPRRQLHEQLCAGLMKLGHPLFEIGKHFFVFVQPLSAHRIVDRLAARQQQTDVVFGNFHDEVCASLVEVIVDLHPAEQIRAAHARQDDAVLDVAIADFPRCKQRR